MPKLNLSPDTLETLDRVAAYRGETLADLLEGLLLAESAVVRDRELRHSPELLERFNRADLVREADTRDGAGMIPDHRRASLERVYGGEA